MTQRGQPIPGYGHGAGQRLLAALPYVSLLGFSGIAVNLMLSFEEPQAAMLLVSALLLVAAPGGLLVHLAVTSDLTAEEKRMWMKALARRGAPILFAAYFNAAERRAVTQKLAESGRSKGQSRRNV